MGVRRTVRLMLGAGLWLSLVLGAAWAVGSLRVGSGQDHSETAIRIWQAGTGQGHWLHFANREQLPLRVGDPVYQEAAPGRLVQVGHVYALIDQQGHQHLQGRFAQGVVYLAPQARLADSMRLEHYQADLSIAAGVQTLFPPEKRRQVQQLLARHWQREKRKMLDALRPVVERTLEDTLAVLQQDLAAELKRREPQLRQLARRWEKDVLEKHLLPVLQEEVFPLAQQEATPLARQIGMELWDRVSLWRFGTAALLDKLTSGKRVEREFEQFLQQEAMPVLKKHSPELLRTAQQIMQQALQRPRVRQALQRGLETMAADEEFRRLLWEVFEQVIVENPRLHQAIRQSLSSAETQQALARVAQSWEAVAQQIGALLLGTPEEGLTPELTRLLRLHVFGKDRRWLVLTLGGEGGVPNPSGRQPRLVVVAGTRRDLVPPVPAAPGARED